MARAGRARRPTRIRARPLIASMYPFGEPHLVVLFPRVTMLAMDRRREVQRWLALRDREGLTYRNLSARSGIPANTLAHWAWRLRREERSTRESAPFVELVSAPLHEALPEFIVQGLSKALLIFDKKMKGYYTEEAQLIAAETRTSSPIRIPRDKETFMHIEIEGLFPCGEGAGYAGGIVSSAIDGENCADAAAKFLN